VASNPVESFGARLKREREQRKISLDDIALSTKIGTRFLSALEEERFDLLPGGMFNKSFVRAYARHLGIDEAQAVADYEAASASVLPQSPPDEVRELEVLAAHARKKRQKASGGISWGLFALALVVIAFGFAIWGFYSREKTAQPRVVPPKTSASAPLNAAQDVPATAAAPVVNVPAPQPAHEPIAQEPTPGSEQPPAVAPSPAAPAPGSFLVQIKAREDSWVAIRADGKPIMQDTLAAPAEKSIEAHNEIVIKTGNVGALDLAFNGKPLPRQGAYSQVKTLTFDVNGLRSGGEALPPAETAHP
jgi:cytoskeleton protein RodZ